LQVAVNGASLNVQLSFVVDALLEQASAYVPTAVRCSVHVYVTPVDVVHDTPRTPPANDSEHFAVIALLPPPSSARATPPATANIAATISTTNVPRSQFITYPSLSLWTCVTSRLRCIVGSCKSNFYAAQMTFSSPVRHVNVDLRRRSVATAKGRDEASRVVDQLSLVP
jgi:hypothetical protein